MRTVLAVVLASFAIASAGAQQRSRDELIAKGRVTEVHSARLFTLQSDVAGESEVLVIPPRAVGLSLVGLDVEVRGALRRFTSAELGSAWKDIDEQARRAFGGRRVLLATSLIATARGEAPSAGQQATPPAEPSLEAMPTHALPTRQPILHVMPTTLVDFITDFAGEHVSVSNVRVVGVFEPGAFLIEPATRHQMMMDYRDRILVLVDLAELTVPPEAIVSATVAVEGIARTLPDLKLKSGTRWPDKLTADAIERLEVRAAIVASSVRTPDGTELTGRAVASR